MTSGSAFLVTTVLSVASGVAGVVLFCAELLGVRLIERRKRERLLAGILLVSLSAGGTAIAYRGRTASGAAHQQPEQPQAVSAAASAPADSERPDLKKPTRAIGRAADAGTSRANSDQQDSRIQISDEDGVRIDDLTSSAEMVMARIDPAKEFRVVGVAEISAEREGPVDDFVTARIRLNVTVRRMPTGAIVSRFTVTTRGGGFSAAAASAQARARAATELASHLERAKEQV